MQWIRWAGAFALNLTVPVAAQAVGAACSMAQALAQPLALWVQRINPDPACAEI